MLVTTLQGNENHMKKQCVNTNYMAVPVTNKSQSIPLILITIKIINKRASLFLEWDCHLTSDGDYFFDKF